MIKPRKRMEYIAPFLRYLYFFTVLMFWIVSSRTAIAARPFPTKISGTDTVNEGSEHAVNGERGIDYLEIEEFTQVA